MLRNNPTALTGSCRVAYLIIGNWISKGPRPRRMIIGKEYAYAECHGDNQSGPPSPLFRDRIGELLSNMHELSAFSKVHGHLLEK